MGIWEGAKDKAQRVWCLLHPVRQQDLDQAPLLCLPLCHPARFYTGEAVGVPHSQQPNGREESCQSFRRPTHHITHRRV